MHVVVMLIIFVRLAAMIVWVADWTTLGDRRATPIDILNRRLARGEIDKAEYDKKRRPHAVGLMTPDARVRARVMGSYWDYKC